MGRKAITQENKMKINQTAIYVGAQVFPSLLIFIISISRGKDDNFLQMLYVPVIFVALMIIPCMIVWEEMRQVRRLREDLKEEFKNVRNNLFDFEGRMVAIMAMYNNRSNNADSGSVSTEEGEEDDPSISSDTLSM